MAKRKPTTESASTSTPAIRQRKSTAVRGRATVDRSPVTGTAATTSEEVQLAVADDASTATAAAGPTQTEIAQAAYARYLRRGGGHGHDLDDWIEAERELLRR